MSVSENLVNDPLLAGVLKPPAPRTKAGFLSVSTNSQGKRMWRVVDRSNQTVCADTESLQRALTVAKHFYGRVTLDVWDGDKGEWDSEMVADPSY